MILIFPTEHFLDSKQAVSSSVHEINEKVNYWIKLANFSDVVYINKGSAKFMTGHSGYGPRAPNFQCLIFKSDIYCWIQFHYLQVGSLLKK